MIWIIHQVHHFQPCHQLQATKHCGQQLGHPFTQTLHQSQPCHQTAQTDRMQPVLQKHFAFIFKECNNEHQVHHFHQFHSLYQQLLFVHRIRGQLCHQIHHFHGTIQAHQVHQFHHRLVQEASQKLQIIHLMIHQVHQVQP